MKAQVLIVDGHSLIFQWPDLAALHERDQETARNHLARNLAAYQDTSGIKVVLVFDGQGAASSSRRDGPAGIQIVYSGKGKTADTIIERFVAAYSHTYDLTVATADRLEQQTVTTFGGSTLEPATLLARMDAATEQVRRDLRTRADRHQRWTRIPEARLKDEG